MFKGDLVKKTAKQAGIDEKTANAAISTALTIVMEGLQAGEDVRLPGFGTFKVKEVPARKARNIRTGEEINVPAHKRITFKPSKKATV